MSTNPRDAWLNFRPAVKTDLINEKIVIPEFDFGYNIASIKAKVTSIKGAGITGNTNILNRQTLTIEVWVKLINFDGVNDILLKETVVDGNDAILIQTSNTDLRVYFRNAAGTIYDILLNNATTGIVFGEWTHLAVVYDASSANSIKTYVNGNLVNTTAITGGQAIASGAGTPICVMGNRDGGDYIVHGFIHMNDLRFWSTARTIDQIQQRRGTLTNINIDTAIIANWKFIEGAGTALFDNTSGLTMTISGGIEWSTTDMFPLTFGGSWIASRMTVDIEKKCSLKFPVSPIEHEPDHALIVSWVDDSGDTQRRYLYTTTGIDIYETVEQYTGERMSNPFYLEIWNKDGVSGANRVSSEELTIYLSTTTQPGNPVDRESQEAATLTHDNTLAQSFPLTPFPLVFNEAQYYS